jgi:molybdate transport system substrate-binding protein
MSRFILLIILFLVSCSRTAPASLTIAVASNSQYALEEINAAFSEKTGVTSDLVVSSSGKLTAQIKEGAPFDLFVSADIKYPNELYLSGLTTDKPMVYAYGKLVLWSTSKEVRPTLERLTSDSVTHVAIANPETAPYGAAALELLKKRGIYEQVQHKLVFGESISQTNQFILSGAADIGFTAKSVVVYGPMKGKGRWLELDPQHYAPLAQGVVMIKNQNTTLSKQYFDFLQSPDGQQILHKYGYDVGYGL